MAKNKLKLIRETLSDLENEIADLKKENEELKQTIAAKEDEEEYSTSKNLGLDTIYYRFENGNLSVVSAFEEWVARVQKQNCVTP